MHVGRWVGRWMADGGWRMVGATRWCGASSGVGVVSGAAVWAAPVAEWQRRRSQASKHNYRTSQSQSQQVGQ